MRRLQRQEGFTLIELMIVVAIIGILAAIALATFQNLTTTARVASEDGVIGALNSAGVIYLGKFSTQPTEAQLRGSISPTIASLNNLDGTNANAGHPAVAWCDTELHIKSTTNANHPTNHTHTNVC